MEDEFCYPEQDFEQVKTYYEQSENNPYAKIALGFLYLNGQGVAEDKEKARELFQSVVDDGVVEGYYALGILAEPENDYGTALEYYQKVANEGTEQLYVSSAMFQIGAYYNNGIGGVEQNNATAVEWWKKAAELNDSTAAYYVGYFYLNGIDIEQDYAQALEWLTKSADMGNGAAMRVIGEMYKKGIGVEQDYATSLDWYKKGAEAGDAIAANQVGWAYDNGDGVDVDYTEAMNWYIKAADMGNNVSMANIAYLYENGLGVEKDMDKAKEWYQKAADDGNEDAKNWLTQHK